MTTIIRSLIAILIGTIVGCGSFDAESKAIFCGGDNLQPLIQDLSRDSLVEKKTFQQIPEFVRDFLDSLTGKFFIANPGEEWQAGCSQPIIIDYSSAKITVDRVTGDSSISYSVKDTIVPSRQLKYFGIGEKVALLKYYSGGGVGGASEHIVIFAFDGDRVTGYWSGIGRLFKDEATKDEIALFLKENKGCWKLGLCPL